MDRTPPDDIPDEDDHHVENEATAEDQRLQEPDKVGTRQKPVSQQEPTGAKIVRCWLERHETLFGSQPPPIQKTAPTPNRRRRRSLSDLEASRRALLGLSRVPPGTRLMTSRPRQTLVPGPVQPPPFPTPFVTPDQLPPPTSSTECDTDFQTLHRNAMERTSANPCPGEDWDKKKAGILKNLYVHQSQDIQAARCQSFITKALQELAVPEQEVKGQPNKDYVTNNGGEEAPQNDVLPTPQPEEDKTEEPSEEEEDWIKQNLGISYIRSCLRENALPAFKYQVPLPFMGAEAGIKVRRLLTPWPSQGHGLKKEQPIFIFVDEEQKYKDLRRELNFHYSSVLRGRGSFPSEHLKAGDAVVYGDGEFQSRYEDRHYERGQILTLLLPKKGTRDEQYAKVYLVDQGTVILTRTSMLYFLFKPFDLPPRVHNLPILGIRSYYSGLQTLHGLLSPSSRIWDGVLTARWVVGGWGWVINSDLVSSHDYSYGISEYILRRIVAETDEGLHPGAVVRGQVVHSEDNGDLWFQRSSPFARHLRWIGSQPKRNPLPPVGPKFFKVGMRVLSSSIVDDYQSNFRAEVLKIDRSGERVKVWFLDYGNLEVVAMNRVALASNLHPFYELLPPTVSRVRLVNLKRTVTTIPNKKVDLNPVWDFLEGEDDHFLRVVGERLGTILIELVKAPPAPTAEDSPRTSETDQPPLNLSLPHFYLDGSTLKEEGATGTPTPPLSLRTIPSLGLRRPRNIPDLSQGLTTPRFDLDTGLLSNPRGRQNQDPRETLFLRPQRFIQFSIAHLDIESGLAYLQPTTVVPLIAELEKELDSRFADPLWSTGTLDTELWSVGSLFVVRSAVLGRPVRAQILTVNRKELTRTFQVELVDYGIRESCSWKDLVHISFEHCQLPATGLRAVLYHRNVEEGVPLPQDRVKLDELVQLMEYTLIARILEEYKKPETYPEQRKRQGRPIDRNTQDEKLFRCLAIHPHHSDEEENDYAPNITSPKIWKVEIRNHIHSARVPLVFQKLFK